MQISLAAAPIVNSSRFALENRALTCRGCHAGQDQKLCGRERFLGTGQELYLCGQCGLAYLAPDFTDEALGQFYAKHYRQISLIDATRHHDAAFFEKTLYREFAQKRVEVLTASLPQNARLLEIGSGFGGFLGRLHAARPDIALYATEADETHRHHLLDGAPVTFLEEAALAQQAPFDAIVLFHVFEHLKHPLQQLRMLKNILKPEGILVIEVPDAEADWGNWLYVQPAHLSYFTRKSLLRLLAHAEIEVAQTGPHPGGPGFTSNLWVIGKKATIPQMPEKVSEGEIAHFAGHMQRYRWNARQTLRHGLRHLFLTLFGPYAAGAMARQRYHRRMAPLFSAQSAGQGFHACASFR